MRVSFGGFGLFYRARCKKSPVTVDSDEQIAKILTYASGHNYGKRNTTFTDDCFISFNFGTWAKIWGGLAYATSNAMNLEMLYLKDGNNFKVGFSLQFSDTRGKQVDEQLSNYGRTVDGIGEYFVTVDFGYGKTIKQRIQLDGELSVGALNYYTNYIDNRFNGGGYHMITNKEVAFGVGLTAGYLVREDWCVYTGFNTVRKLQFGVRWLFLTR